GWDGTAATRARQPRPAVPAHPRLVRPSRVRPPRPVPVEHPLQPGRPNRRLHGYRARPSGEDAAQVVTLALATGKRTQLTSLAPPDQGFVARGRFVSEDAIVFAIADDQGDPVRLFTVKTDGSGFAPLPSIVSAAGGAVVPDFSVVGGGTALVT